MPIKAKHRTFQLGKAIPGECRFCRKPILHPKTNAILTRKTWHSGCVPLYKAIAWPAELRKAVWDRDKGICTQCGHDTSTPLRLKHPNWSEESIAYTMRSQGGDYWQADHIVPLAAGGSFEHHNVQTLCTVCHKKKSKDDLQTIKSYRKDGGIP